MKIGFMVNDSVPGMGLPCSGQGLRAWGLIEGLRALGVDARALLRDNMISARQKRWKELSSCLFPDWVDIVNHETLSDTLSGFDAVVFHNWAAAEQVSKPENNDVRFVYDFFSATLIEHSFINPDPARLEKIKQRKCDILEMSDVFIANGPGRRDYAIDFLGDIGIRGEVHDIPMSLPWLGDAKTTNTAMVGGYQQDWTKPIADNALHSLARGLSDRNLVMVGAGLHYHFGARGAGPAQRNLPENIICYDVLSFEDYASVNAASAAFLDVSPINEERLISFSSRGVLSIACGCPVIHNAETDLGQMISDHDAGVIIPQDHDISDPAVLLAAAEHCLARDRRDNCRALWAAVFDAEKGARSLLEALADA